MDIVQIKHSLKSKSQYLSLDGYLTVLADADVVETSEVGVSDHCHGHRWYYIEGNDANPSREGCFFTTEALDASVFTFRHERLASVWLGAFGDILFVGKKPTKATLTKIMADDDLIAKWQAFNASLENWIHRGIA